MSAAVPVRVTCPLCRTPFTAEVHNVVDVGRNPEMKRALLQGMINIATCPQCGQAGMLAAPLLYHDPDKELLLVFVPDQMNIKPEERERLIGNLINSMIATIPQEKRKGYLLRPETFLTMERLLERILLADGITKEAIEAQREAIRLLQRLLDAKDQNDVFQELVEQNRQQIDYEFFLLISASIDAAQQDGDLEQAEELANLREKLLAIAAPPGLEPLPENATREDLVDRLLKADSEEMRENLVISNRALVDYTFFQGLTERIEALEQSGEESQAEKLKALRSEVLELTEELDRQVKVVQDEVTSIIEELLASDDLERTIPAHPQRYDTLFFVMLEKLMASAQRAGEEARLKKLSDLRQRVIRYLQEQMPPEVQLVNQLLFAEYPEGTQKVLEEQRSQLSQELVETMRGIATDLEKQQPTTAERLRQIADQAAALLSNPPSASAA